MHQEDSVLVEGPYELLSPIDFVLNVGNRAIEKVKTFLVLHVNLSDDLKHVLSDLIRPLVCVEPRHKKNSENQDDEVIED